MHTDSDACSRTRKARVLWTELPYQKSDITQFVLLGCRRRLPFEPSNVIFLISPSPETFSYFLVHFYVVVQLQSIWSIWNFTNETCYRANEFDDFVSYTFKNDRFEPFRLSNFLRFLSRLRRNLVRSHLRSDSNLERSFRLFVLFKLSQPGYLQRV